MNRRLFVTAVGMGLTSLAGCATLSGETNDTPTRTSTPKATATRTPDQTATPTESLDPTPAPTMERTATLKFETPETGRPFASTPPEAYRTVDFGSRENVENSDEMMGNAVRIFRYPEEAATFEVQVADLNADAMLLHQVFQIPADRSVQLEFHEKSHYAVNLYDFKYESGQSLDNKEYFFDCNHRQHTFFSHSNGEYTWNTLATRKKCD